MSELPFEWMAHYYAVGRRVAWQYGCDHRRPGELPCTGFEFKDNDGRRRWEDGEGVTLSSSGDFRTWDEAVEWARQSP